MWEGDTVLFAKGVFFNLYLHILQFIFIIFIITKTQKLGTVIIRADEIELKVTVDLQRPNFMTFFFFAHNIAKTSI